MKQLMSLTVILIAAASLAIADVPQVITYQGYLTNSFGAPLDTTVSMAFAIYDDSVAGNEWWTEVHSNVEVDSGNFSVILGNSIPIVDSIFAGSQRWFEITVGEETISPRTRFGSMPYSYRVSTIDSAFGGIIFGTLGVMSETTGKAQGPDSRHTGEPDIWGGIIGGGHPTKGPLPGHVHVYDISGNIVFDVDGSANGRTTIGSGNTNSGQNSFVAGVQCQATGDYSTIGGGFGDTASGDYSTIGGGYRNIALAENSTVGGGEGDTSSGVFAGVFCGFHNLAGDDVDDTSAFVGGGYENRVTAKFATIGGGCMNNAGNQYSTISGGLLNNAAGDFSVVGGGFQCQANGNVSTISGGSDNTAIAGYTFIGGGADNSAEGQTSVISGGENNRTQGSFSTVGGGYCDTALGEYTFVGGGYGNSAQMEYGTVCGGVQNHAYGPLSIAGGGGQNRAYSRFGAVFSGNNNWGGDDHDDTAAFIGGGLINRATAAFVTIGGGSNNTASGSGATVGGGRYNVAGGLASVVGGGTADTSTGFYATVPGGYCNKASGNYSFAAGNRAKAENHGCFVWADQTNADFTSTDDDQFLVRASGGVGIGTTNPQGALDVNSTTGAFIVPRMTTTERDALSAINGMIIYNTTDNQFNFYENGAWVLK